MAKFFMCVRKKLHKPTKDLFLCSSDREFASSVDVCVVRQVESSEARLGEVCQEDIPSFAKVGFPHLVAGLEIGEFSELDFVASTSFTIYIYKDNYNRYYLQK